MIASSITAKITREPEKAVNRDTLKSIDCKPLFLMYAARSKKPNPRTILAKTIKMIVIPHIVAG
jgi:hypothetical protein